MAGNFDTIAKYYDRLAEIIFGKSLRDAQIFFLDRIPEGSTVLVIGGGTGWWLPKLLADKRNIQICYFETSAKMLDIARKKVNSDSRVSFVLGTVNEIEYGKQYDAVITYCFLDLFETRELGTIIRNIKSVLSANVIWLVSDFVNTRSWHGLLLFIMYRFFRLIADLENQRLPDWELAFSRSGFHEIDQKFFFGNFIKSAVYKIIEK